MDELRYKIKIDGVVIAAFLNEYDRNVSLDTLAEEFDDYEFTATEIE